MFSKLRRTHMYLALFLTPWILVYALSTMAMNHRRLFSKRGDNPVRFEKESEQTYTGTFPFQARPGKWRCSSSRVSTWKNIQRAGKPEGERITILRQDPVFPRRITFTPKSGFLVWSAKFSTLTRFSAHPPSSRLPA